MSQPVEVIERRTTADVVFDYLYEQIGTLNLLPGAKISEAEIANKFGVSRQPVRDAFSRLGNLDLLLIRPQKATVVKKFSLRAIETARFVRLSVELEVLRKAAAEWDGHLDDAFVKNMAAQRAALANKDADEFHALDYEFHRLLCDAARAEFAFEIIQQNKNQVDRLCVLSLGTADEMRQLVDDHALMLERLQKRDEVGASDTIREHLSRLDGTIETIYETHASYFET